MKLIECEPAWINHEGRVGVGMRFVLPPGPWKACMVRILFENPLDGGPPLPNDDAHPTNNGGSRWTRIGTDFDHLTISPSINGGSGEWHGGVTNGEVDGALEP